MHEQARLKSPFPAAAKFVDELVSISLVERHFKTSDDANSALTFVCADCGVPVSAVIIEPFKAGRKITHSSNFRRRSRSQPHTCHREPPPNEERSESSSGGGSAAAHPHADEGPTRWVDPRVASASSGLGGAQLGSEAGGLSGVGSKKRSASGSGASESRSQTVEKFARSWRDMDVAHRKKKPLLAPWNPHGTFFSGFHPLDYDPKIPSGHMKIFVGSAREVLGYPDGFDVVLRERKIGGPELCVWIPTPCLAQGAVGAALQKQLLDYASTPSWARPVQVHVLGIFDRYVGLPDPVLGLEVGHPHMIWLS